MINPKLASGLSPRRVQYIHAVLRRALGQAEKWGKVARNVAKLVDAPRVDQVEIQPFTPEEARAFLQAIKGERLEALYTLAIATGLRQAELLGLAWTDLDLDEAQLTVRTTLQRIDGEFHFVEPKTARSRRTLALPDMVVDVLRAHWGRQIGEMLQAGTEWQESGLVFTAPNGGPLSDGVVRARFYRILENAGLRRQRFHDLRHSCASLLIATGVGSREVMETLGHSTIVLTLNTYGHIFRETQRERPLRRWGKSSLVDAVSNPVAVNVAVKSQNPPITKAPGKPRGPDFVPRKLVPGEGLEPTQPLSQRILSPPRLPFRHPGIIEFALNNLDMVWIRPWSE